MSKNLYRINKKSDLDEIMKNNFYKPISIFFLSKNNDKKLYDDVANNLITLSKQLTYCIMLIVNFDDFIDNVNFFDQIKKNLPQMITYFKAKQIAKCDDKDNFIEQISNIMEQIHNSYLQKLMNAFNQSVNNTENEQNKINQSTLSNNVDKDIQTINQTQNEIKQNLINENINNDKKHNKSKEQSQNDDLNEDLNEDENEDEDPNEDEEPNEDENEDKINSINSKKSEDMIIKKDITEDNTTEMIELKKQKYKEIKKLQQMLNSVSNIKN